MSKIDAFQPTRDDQFDDANALLSDVLRDLNMMPRINDTAIMIVEQKLTMLNTQRSSLDHKRKIS